MLDILHEKHPEPGVIDESAFMSCDDLPPLLDLDITAENVESMAHQIQGSLGLVDLLHCSGTGTFSAMMQA